MPSSFFHVGFCIGTLLTVIHFFAKRDRYVNCKPLACGSSVWLNAAGWSNHNVVIMYGVVLLIIGLITLKWFQCLGLPWELRFWVRLDLLRLISHFWSFPILDWKVSMYLRKLICFDLMNRLLLYFLLIVFHQPDVSYAYFGGYSMRSDGLACYLCFWPWVTSICNFVLKVCVVLLFFLSLLVWVLSVDYCQWPLPAYLLNASKWKIDNSSYQC